MKQKTPRSLKSRALQLLAQREQSRVELRRKLLDHARADDSACEQASVGEAVDRLGDARAPSEASEASEADHASASSVGWPQGPGNSGTTRSSRQVDVARSASTDALPGVSAQFSGHEKGARLDAACRVDEVLAWLESRGFLSDARFVESRVNARSSRYGNVRIRQELKQHGVAIDDDTATALGESEASRAWSVWERRFDARPETAADLARQSRFLVTRGFSPDTVRQVMRRARALPVVPR